MKQSNKKQIKGHLTAQERDKITILKSEGLSIRKIAVCRLDKTQK